MIERSRRLLICIAGGFNRYEEHAVQQINCNIELMRNRRYGDDLVNAVTGSTIDDSAPTTPPGTGTYKSISATPTHRSGE